MSYSRFQQFVSYLLIISILFLQTFEIPFLNKAQAEDQTNSRIISFIVDEATYQSLSSEINQYAKDIQGYMDNVRVAIFPVPRTINPYEIASINERLYYQGDGNGLSELIGTIIIGPVPIPVVHKNDKTFLSLYPYTDFDEKAFVYNQTKNYYEYTDKSLTNERPEIWHSVIAPNSGDELKNQVDLQAFFAKTHDFYTSKGVFSESLADPYVFYYDGLREQQSTQLVPWEMYQEWIKNIEDITYKRTNKALLTTINNLFQSYSSSETTSGIDTTQLDPKLQGLLGQAANASDDFTGMPDIMARQAIDKLFKIFHETINSVYFGDLMKFVFNTGRYGNGQDVRVDTIPFLIDKKDREMQQALFVGNNLLEKTVDDIVASKLAKPVKIKTEHIDCRDGGINHNYYLTRYYNNYIEGTVAEKIERPEQCSVFRGDAMTGSTLVEADRAFSTANFSVDTGTYKDGKLGVIYGDHSPYNIDFSKQPLDYKPNVFPNKLVARSPLFDITGALERKGGANTPDRIAEAPSYKDCLVADNFASSDDNGVHDCSAGDSYKEIPSWMTHKSPTDAEYKALFENKTAQSLPIDKDRYIDFQNQSGQYQKIIYPNLFRFTTGETLSGTLSYSGVLATLQQSLDKKSAEIGDGINLFATLSQNKNMLDSIVRNILWLNLPTPTAKYKYVLENYLDIDGKSPLKDVAHKTDYEMGYIGAPGTTQNMYVRLDPEEKGDAPAAIKDILTKANASKQALDAAKITKNNSQKPAEFKCGKPEGVPLLQWPSAIQCWLKNLMPVGISAGSCSAATLGMTNVASSDENSSSVEDTNRNGVPDAAERIANGILDLTTSKKVAQYGDPVNLEARLFESDRKTLIADDSFSEVNFSITKIISKENNNSITVYDTKNPNLSDTGILAEYVTFKPLQVRAQAGKVSYVVSSKYQDSDIYLRANILTKDQKNIVVVDTTSDPVILKIRGDAFGVISKIKPEPTSDNSTPDYETSSSVQAGNPFGIVFDFDKKDKNENNIPLASPYKLQVFNDITGETVENPVVIPAASKESYIYKNPNILNIAGVYRFVFTDAEGFDATQTITVLPGSVTNIKVTPASTKFVKGQGTSIFVELYDVFGNIAKGDVYDVSAKITNGAGIFPDSKTTETHQNFSEGFGTFQVDSAEKGITNVKFSIPGLESEVVSLEAVDYAKVITTIQDPDAIFVGGNSHKIDVKIVDASGQPIQGFHTSAAVSVPALSGELSTNIIDIRDGVSTTSLFFTPNIVSQDSVKLSIQVLGVEDISGNEFTIHPEKPARIGFSDSSNKIEAKDGNFDQIQFSLYDRYGNIASYKTESYTATLTIGNDYISMIHFSSGSLVQHTTEGDKKDYLFVKGVGLANIYTSDIPGGSWLIAKLNGDIPDTQVITKGPDGKDSTLIVPAVTQDAAKIDTYYFWNQEKLDATKYNTFYTTLFGSSYGDVTQPNYLGGSIVFNPAGRSLAVTTLLNNPYQKNLAFGFTPAGKYIAPTTTDKIVFNITPQFEANSNHYVVNLYDTLYKETVARAWISPSVDSSLVVCDGGGDINSCAVPADKPYILLQGSSYAQSQRNTDSLDLFAGGIKVLELGVQGVKYAYPGVTLDLDSEATGNYLGMKVGFNGETIGYAAIKLQGDAINVYPSSAFPGILANVHDALTLETVSNRYNAVGQYLGNSSAGPRGVAVYQWADDTDEFSPDETLLGGGDLMGLEQALKENGIGWQTSNKMMLEFAAGAGMGDATRFYQTYSTINLGDPVAHLPQKKNPISKQDRTIGMKIAEGRGEQIESYKKLDFNGDNQEDIALFYKSGKVELLANYGGNFKNLGYWAYAPDAAVGSKNVGFFAGPDKNGRKYSSLVMISQKTGQLILFENRDGKLVRRDMSSEVKPSKGESRIRQMEVFDMDKDGADDLVVLFENGELDIFYGGTRIDAAGNKVIAFTKKLVDPSLQIRLSTEKRNDGGAIYFSGLPQLPDTNGQTESQQDFLKDSQNTGNTSDPSASTEEMLFNKFVYYQYPYNTGASMPIDPATDVAGISQSAGNTASAGDSTSIAQGWQDITNSQNQDTTFTPSADETITSRNLKPLTFIRSEYSEAKGVTIEKTYTSGTGNIVTTGTPITVQITIKNTSGKYLDNIIYLEQPDPIVHISDSLDYILDAGGKIEQKTAKELTDGDFTYSIEGLTLAPQESITITYVGIANPVEIGKINVGTLENDDPYGDIALNPNKTCGATYTLWKSIASRAYLKTNKTFQSRATSPIDSTKIQSISDQIQQLSQELQGASDARRAEIMAEISTLTAELKKGSPDMYEDANGNGIPDNQELPGSDTTLLSDEGIQAVGNTIDDTVKGLGCGFGGGGCVAMPMNDAPLAPGSSPVFMGNPIMPLKPESIAVQRGLPVFAFPTTTCIPPAPIGIWPPCPIGAGGWFPDGATNSIFRLFWTPTLTGGQGIAMCLGLRKAAGTNPGTGLSPIVPGGNCIVIAASLNMCKDDGSEGDIGGLGYGDSGNNSTGKSYLNADACKKPTEKLTEDDRQQLIIFAKGGTFNREQLAKRLSTFAGNIQSRSLISLGGDPSGGSASAGVGIDANAINQGNWKDIVKINLKRVFPFPNFIMQWVTLQIEEFVNKLTSLPTLYIILPDLSALGGNLKNVSDKFKDIDKSSTPATKKTQTFGTLWNGDGKNTSTQNRLNAYAQQTKSVSGMQQAFALIGSLPLLEIDNEELSVTIPWIDQPTIDKMLKSYKNTAAQWENEIKNKTEEWQKLGTLSGSSQAVLVDASNSVHAINKNIKVLDEYSKFPEKLYKLLSWKETYIEQILCNIASIQEVTVGWMGRNGKRFKAWVELYVLIKAILKSWQLMIDVFTGYEAECSSCKNERWDLQHFIWKLISMVLPQIPVIQFPKWPDIILDLHNIRAGIRVKVPTFAFEPKPIVLPYLPKLSLPDTPTLGIGLPQIPVLPGLPMLPSLPELPSLPKIELPDLPPPPTIPKLFGYIEVFLNILKLIKKILCLMRINPFVPEWYAGAQIAIITERQGKLPIDFIETSMPQFSYPWVDAIKVSTYVNLEFDADFIIEFARAILDPLNQFTTDFSHLGGAVKTPKGISVPGIDGGNVNVGAYAPQNDYIKGVATKFVYGVASEIQKFVTYLDGAKNDTITTEQMKQLFAENISSLEKNGGQDGKNFASVLQSALNYDGSTEDKIIANLTQEQQKKWKTIHAILDESNNQNKAFKTELGQILQGKKSLADFSALSDYKIGSIKTSTHIDAVSSTLISALDASNKKTLSTILNPKPTTDPTVTDIKKLGTNINSRVETGMQDFTKLMAYNASLPSATLSDSSLATDSFVPATTSTSSSTNSSTDVSATTPTSTSSDTYEYKGIYLLYPDPSGKIHQTHLFDYTDETDGTEEVIPIDARRDGNEDVIFRVGNSIYIKYAGDTSPKNTSENTHEYNWQDFLGIQNDSKSVESAPNYFEESFDAPNEINLSFRPANQQKDKKFRMEYFDYIDKFDQRDAGEQEKDMPTNMRKEVVDMTTDLSSETLVSDAFTGVELHDTIATFGRGEGEGSLTMPMYDIWTSDKGIIDVTSGKTIYTDSQGAIIEYRSDGGAQWRQITIQPGQNVVWKIDGKMRVISGDVVLFRDSSETRLLNLGELNRFPIIPGTRLEPVKTSNIDINYYQNENSYTLENGTAYEYHDLGDVSNEYQVTLSQQNGFYYAKLYSFAFGIDGTKTALGLFAPQIQSDTQAPIISLGKSFRIPVYQTKQINMLKYIDDVSGIDRIWTEGDNLINVGTTALDLVFGRYTSLFKKSIQFIAEDLAGNISKQPISLEIYSPVPQITNIGSGVITGVLDEALKDEPIDIFRYRDGRIDRVSKSNILTDDLGQFQYSPESTASGVILKDGSGATVLTIDETTGKIRLQQSGYSFRVIGATSTNRTTIQVLNSNNESVFSQTYTFPDNFSIEKADSFDAITQDGIYVKIEQDGFDVVKNSSQVPGLPYGAYVVDAEKKPIAGIDRDGNIYLMSSDVSLKYRETGSNTSLLLVNKTNQTLAEIFLKMKAEYVVK